MAMRFAKSPVKVSGPPGEWDGVIAQSNGAGTFKVVDPVSGATVFESPVSKIITTGRLSWRAVTEAGDLAITLQRKPCGCGR